MWVNNGGYDNHLFVKVEVYIRSKWDVFLFDMLFDHLGQQITPHPPYKLKVENSSF